MTKWLKNQWQKTNKTTFAMALVGQFVFIIGFSLFLTFYQKNLWYNAINTSSVIVLLFCLINVLIRFTLFKSIILWWKNLQIINQNRRTFNKKDHKEKITSEQYNSELKNKPWITLLSVLAISFIITIVTLIIYYSLN
ncbi:unknown; predicted coding region [Mycoplasmopsis pulmonis]|uniref:DUF3899 domain-containing protein n=1 Tax=Mycoplasmopsis pulmonis (strain UAB CTIP) TaxID=272635 RepID=Q98QT1_MYCPU|nr:hypothetical protein [Mycoplasmopsis pulmonis]MDZ7293239.1 hypothetical protein [Mycoplasmopsis pulmonis]CAC13453.1 unknown; predicted coding region [Mycoplasmopsis pulmonis]VEU68041.1 Uncharacterised protein [Mycoplasmopsis pulmonis]